MVEWNGVMDWIMEWWNGMVEWAGMVGWTGMVEWNGVMDWNGRVVGTSSCPWALGSCTSAFPLGPSPLAL